MELSIQDENRLLFLEEKQFQDELNDEETLELVDLGMRQSVFQEPSNIVHLLSKDDDRCEIKGCRWKKKDDRCVIHSFDEDYLQKFEFVEQFGIRSWFDSEIVIHYHNCQRFQNEQITQFYLETYDEYKIYKLKRRHEESKIFKLVRKDSSKEITEWDIDLLIHFETLGVKNSYNNKIQFAISERNKRLEQRKKFIERKQTELKLENEKINKRKQAIELSVNGDIYYDRKISHKEMNNMTKTINSQKSLDLENCEYNYNDKIEKEKFNYEKKISDLEELHRDKLNKERSNHEKKLSDIEYSYKQDRSKIDFKYTKKTNSICDRIQQQSIKDNERVQSIRNNIINIHKFLSSLNTNSLEKSEELYGKYISFCMENSVVSISIHKFSGYLVERFFISKIINKSGKFFVIDSKTIPLISKTIEYISDSESVGSN